MTSADTKSEPRIARDINLERKFVGLAFDEIHLQGLAAKVKQLGAELGARTIFISLDSADGVEHLELETRTRSGRKRCRRKSVT